MNVPRLKLGLAALLAATMYLLACVLPGEPSDAERLEFRLDFPQPYRVPLAGSAEPAITIVADGRVLQNAGYRLESLDPDLVEVDASGRRLEGLGRGPSSVRVVYTTAMGALDTVFTVQVVVSRVAVDSPALAFTRLGATTRLSATAYDANEAAVSNMAFTWFSADPQVATVNDTGLVRAVDEGTAAIVAGADGVEDTSEVTVTQVAAAVRVAPELDTLRTVGRSVQFIALAFDSSNNLLRTARPRWSSSDTMVTTVDGAGRATATGAGTARIIARVGEAADTGTLVVAQVIRFLVVTPGYDTLTAIADTARIAALAFDSLNFPIPNAIVGWATSDAAVATVDQTGLVHAANNGVVLVTASAAGQSAFATLLVRQEVRTARIVQDSVALTGAGDTLRLSATGLDGNGFVVGGAVFTWRSRNVLVATVDAVGLVTAWGDGRAGITATPVSGGQSDTATVTVTGAPQPAVIAFESQGIEMMSADGSGRRVLLVDGGEPAWSPDGARLAFGSGCGILTANADGSNARIVTDGTACDFSPAWSPDGTRIAFSRRCYRQYFGAGNLTIACREGSQGYESYYIHVVNADGSNLRMLGGSNYDWDLNPTWSPDGAKLAFEGYPGGGDVGAIYVVNAESNAYCDGCMFVYSGYQPAWSPDGSQLAYNSEDGRGRGLIRLVNLDGSNGRDLTSGVGWTSSPAWSPDGAQIVFASGSPDCGLCSGDLYVINRDGTGLQQLTSTPEDERNPSWRQAPPPPGSQAATGARLGPKR